jgi:hypothetical protein
MKSCAEFWERKDSPSVRDSNLLPAATFWASTRSATVFLADGSRGRRTLPDCPAGGKSKQVIDHLPIQKGSLGDWSGGVAYIDDPEPSKRGQGYLLTLGSPLKPPCLLPNKATALGLGSIGSFQSCKMLDPQGACKFLSHRSRKCERQTVFLAKSRDLCFLFIPSCHRDLFLTRLSYSDMAVLRLLSKLCILTLSPAALGLFHARHLSLSACSAEVYGRAGGRIRILWSTSTTWRPSANSR